MAVSYENNFGDTETRARFAFGQALQHVTAAVGAAKKERAALIKDVVEAVEGL
jgi:hypothetical protein